MYQPEDSYCALFGLPYLIKLHLESISDLTWVKKMTARLMTICKVQKCHKPCGHFCYLRIYRTIRNPNCSPQFKHDEQAVRKAEQEKIDLKVFTWGDSWVYWLKRINTHHCKYFDQANRSPQQRKGWRRFETRSYWYFFYCCGDYQYSDRKGTDCGNGRNERKPTEIRLKQRKTVSPHGLHRILHSDCPLEYNSHAGSSFYVGQEPLFWWCCVQYRLYII